MEDYNLQEKIIHCGHCKKQFFYESKTSYLENRLTELCEHLDRTEMQINKKKVKHKDEILQVENDLKIKIEELIKQQKLEEKVLTFENRLKEAEKKNLKQIELETKIFDIETQIKIMHEHIHTKNKDIEKKTNYIEKQINSYSLEKINNNDFEKKLDCKSSKVIN